MYALYPLVTLFCIGSLSTVSGQGCSSTSTDIILLLDMSESLKTYNVDTDSFVNAANYSFFVGDLLSRFDSSAVQVGIVDYSSTSQVVQPLTSNYAAVQSAVDGLSNEFRTQNTNMGIQTAVDGLSGSSPERQRYIVAFLDGTSFDAAATRGEVVGGGAENITFIAVDMMSTLEEAAVIAGRSYRTFSVNSPTELTSSSIAKDIADIVCAECKGNADVMFLLDGSDSTRRISEDFSRIFYAPGVIDFVKNVTMGVNMGPVQEALIVYSASTTVIQTLTGVATDVFNAVKATNPEYLNTDAGLAFNKARELLIGSQRAADTRKLVVYLVDGGVFNTTDLFLEATSTRALPSEIFSIGFGPAALTIDLLLASNDESTTTRVDSDMELNIIVPKVIDFICGTPPSLTT